MNTDSPSDRIQDVEFSNLINARNVGGRLANRGGQSRAQTIALGAAGTGSDGFYDAADIGAPEPVAQPADTTPVSVYLIGSDSSFVSYFYTYEPLVQLTGDRPEGTGVGAYFVRRAPLLSNYYMEGNIGTDDTYVRSMTSAAGVATRTTHTPALASVALGYPVYFNGDIYGIGVATGATTETKIYKTTPGVWTWDLEQTITGVSAGGFLAVSDNRTELLAALQGYGGNSAAGVVSGDKRIFVRSAGGSWSTFNLPNTTSGHPTTRDGCGMSEYGGDVLIFASDEYCHGNTGTTPDWGASCYKYDSAGAISLLHTWAAVEHAPGGFDYYRDFMLPAGIVNGVLYFVHRRYSQTAFGTVNFFDKFYLSSYDGSTWVDDFAEITPGAVSSTTTVDATHVSVYTSGSTVLWPGLNGREVLVGSTITDPTTFSNLVLRVYPAGFTSTCSLR